MALDELLKGLAVFQQGMQDYAVGTATNRAHDTINKANQIKDNETERLKEISIATQRLALDLTRAGAPAASIQAATEQISPTPYQQTTLGQQQERIEVEQGHLKVAQDTLEYKKGQVKADTALLNLKESEKVNKATFDKLYQARKDFRSKNTKSVDAINQARIGKELVKAGNPVGDAGARVFFARALGEVGNLTEAEQERMEGSRALWEQAKNAWRMAKEGKMSESNRRTLIKLADEMEKANTANLKSQAKMEAKTLHNVLKRINPELKFNEVESTLFDTNTEVETTQKAPEQNMSVMSEQNMSVAPQPSSSLLRSWIKKR